MRLLKAMPHGMIAITALFIICLVFFHEALFSGEIMNATDVLTQAYFWNVFIKENLVSDPCFRTWLPYVNAGTPFSGGLDLLFRPMAFWTLVLMPVDVAINYEMVLYFFLFGVGMYVYMKEIGVSSLSAFLAALFLMLNGETVTLMNAGHVNKMGAIFPTTFVFWAFERALRRKTLGSFLLTGAILGFAFWQGHIQISYYLCLAIGIYYLVRAAMLYAGERNLKQIARLTVLALIMVVVFLLVSASHFLPILTFAGVSERSEGVSYDFAVTWSMPPEELITYVIPEFFGLRRLNTDDDEHNLALYWGRMPFTQTGRYFGLIPLLFCILAVCFVRHKHVLTLSVLAGIVLLLGMGKYIPTYRWLYDHAPGFNMFRVPQMILYLFAFAACALAGIGADWFLSELSDRKERQLRMVVLIGMALAMGAWIVTALFPPMEPAWLAQFAAALSRNNAIPEQAQERLHHIYRGLLAFNVFFGFSLFAFGLRLTKRLRLPMLVAILLAVYLADIWRFDEQYLDTVPIEDSWYVNENDAIRYVKNDPGYYRIFPLTNSPSTYGVANKFVLHHLFSISGYEAVGVQYYTDYLNRMELGSPLIDLLNIKYLIFPKDTQLEDGSPIEVGKLVGPYKIVMDADAVLVENLNVLPRAFPVHQARVLTTSEEIFATLLDPSFTPAETVILEETPPASAEITSVPASDSQVEITDYANRNIRLHASMAADGFVVLSEKFYAGWKAYVDGQPAKIYKADYTLQAIAVPQGEHELLFTYRPNDFWLGFWITIVTCISVAGFLAFESRVTVFWARIPRRFLKRLATLTQNIGVTIVTIGLVLVLVEAYMRRAPQFQTGGDREPRNDTALTWEKPDGVKRVVVLGDSLTFGDGVKATETYPYQLQQLLRANLDPDIQVLNLGIMGINIDQEAMILTRSNPYFGRPALDFDPDLLVLTFCVNDIELMPDPKPRPETFFVPKRAHAFLYQHSVLYRFAHGRLNYVWSVLGFQPSYPEYLQRLYRTDTPEWRQFQEYLTYIIAVAEAQRIPFLLVIIPAIDRFDESHPYTDLYAKVTALAEAQGVFVESMLPYFQGRNAASFRVSMNEWASECQSPCHDG